MVVETANIGLVMLGIFRDWLVSFTYDKLKKLAEGLKEEPLKDLFIRAFEESLDHQDRLSGDFLKELKAAVERNPDRLVKIFEAGTGNFHDFLAASTGGEFQKKTAQLIMAEFLPGPLEIEHPGLLEILVRESLSAYQRSFIETMSDREALQTILYQTLNLSQILATKEDIKEIKDLFQGLFREKEQVEKAERVQEKEAEIEGKQIKVLAMTASPKESDPLLYELEQDTLLEVFGRFERRRVFLDMPDPVKSTLEEIREHLLEGKHDILQITAHGGLDEEGHGLLSFEDEEGNLQKVKGRELADLLISLKKEQEIDVKLVILSACHSARRELHLMPTARLLHQAGIGAVVGMKESISHRAAIDFNVGFFQALLDKQEVRRAFDEGCRAVARGEAQRLRDNPSWEQVGEAKIPQLLTGKEPLTVDDFSDFIIEAPDRPQSHHFEGAKYLDRGFIGRRDILRRLYKGVDDGAGALVLKGPGGIGKSTITTRAAANLRRRNYEFIVIRGETEPGLILQSLSRKATEAGLEEADEVYAAPASPQQKLNWFLEHYITGRQVVLIFDNFEENQQMDGSFPEEKTELNRFLLYFRECLENRESLLLFSTRYRLAGFDTLEVGEFSPVEFRKSLLNTAALKQLDGDSMASLRREVGGNPRALELLDRIAREEFGSRAFDWQALKTLIPELTGRIIHKAGDADDFTPLYLDKLLEFITPSQYHLLQLLSLYRDPVPKAAIEAHDCPLTRPDRQRLQSLSLIEYQPTPALHYVHRLTAHHILAKLPPEAQHQSHLRAAAYFADIRSEEGHRYVEYLMEARWHYLQAGAWDEAADLTFALEDHLTLHGHPQLSLHLLTEIMEKPLSQKNRAITYHQMGILHQHFGRYDLALDHYNQSIKIDEKRGDDKGVATSLHQIGMIYQYKGDYEAALEQYRRSLEIKEKIGDIAGMAITFGQMGKLAFKGEDFGTALRYFIRAFSIFKQIGSPTAKQAANDIRRVREKMGEEAFLAVLKEMGVTMAESADKE